MAKKYFYAVRRGVVPGVYDTWGECEANVKGVTGASFKKFKTHEEAVAFVNADDAELTAAAEEKKYECVPENGRAVAYVDGSFNSDTGDYGFGLVFLYDGERQEICGCGNEHIGGMNEMRNVAGEISACMKAVDMAVAAGAKALDVYYDYEGIAAWATGAWKCKKEGTAAYRDFMQKCPIPVRFFHVRAHTGNRGNEAADRLAKR